MSDWNRVQIGQVGQLVTGSTPSTSIDSFWGNDVPFITPADINDSPYVITAERSLSRKGALFARLIPVHSVMVIAACLTCSRTTALPRSKSSWNKRSLTRQKSYKSWSSPLR